MHPYLYLTKQMTISKTETLIVTHHDYMPFFFECVCMCTVYPPFFLNVLPQMLHSKAENKNSNLETFIAISRFVENICS